MSESATINTERDIGAIVATDWPFRDLHRCSQAREPHFQIVYKQSVLDEIHLHGQGSPTIEVCGVLVGNGYHDARGPYLLVEHCIRGNNASSKATNVTFTADTWQHIQEVMDRDHPDKKILGWYHTHPGFGIFLSDMDIFICDNFFNLPWQAAFVYDPIGGDEGNFIWRGGRPEKEPILVENDVTPAAAEIPLISTEVARSGSADFPPVVTKPLATSDTRLIELSVRVRRLERRVKLMFWLFAFLMAFVIVWATQFTSLPSNSPSTKPATQPTTQASSQYPKSSCDACVALNQRSRKEATQASQLRPILAQSPIGSIEGT